MSPESVASAGALARLRRELAHDTQALARHSRQAEELVARWSEHGSDPGDLARAAVALHGWYTGLETLLERVLRQLDGAPPTAQTSHRDILFQATAELPATRPAILPAELVDELLQLLAFRHFFRHSYAVELDPARLGAELQRLVRVAPEVHRALSAFDAFLERALSILTER